MESLEFESRATLNEAEYEKIASYFLNNQSFTPFIISLTNEYFDNDNLDLLNSKIVLRVRSSISDGIILTAKIPLTNIVGDKEISQVLSMDEYESFKKGIFPDGPVKKTLKDKDKLFQNIKYQRAKGRESAQKGALRFFQALAGEAAFHRFAPKARE